MNEFIKVKIREIRAKLHEMFEDISFSDDEIIGAALANFLAGLRRHDHGRNVEN